MTFADRLLRALEGVSADCTVPDLHPLSRDIVREAAKELRAVMDANYVTLVCRQCGCFTDDPMGICPNHPPSADPDQA